MTFGSMSFERSAYSKGATMQALVSELVRSTHITAVQGRIVGDESYFDSLRGNPWSGYQPDLPDLGGLLSALSYNRGFADFAGVFPQSRPALYATQQFVAELAAKFGIAPRLNDGSGLSWFDSTSPRQVVTVLRQMQGDPDFLNSLAIGGETGTLQHEMRGTAAQGNCHGKTGTLHNVANLA